MQKVWCLILCDGHWLLLSLVCQCEQIWLWSMLHPEQVQIQSLPDANQNEHAQIMIPFNWNLIFTPSDPCWRTPLMTETNVALICRSRGKLQCETMSGQLLDCASMHMVAPHIAFFGKELLRPIFFPFQTACQLSSFLEVKKGNHDIALFLLCFIFLLMHDLINDHWLSSSFSTQDLQQKKNQLVGRLPMDALKHKTFVWQSNKTKNRKVVGNVQAGKLQQCQSVCERVVSRTNETKATKLVHSSEWLLDEVTSQQWCDYCPALASCCLKNSTSESANPSTNIAKSIHKNRFLASFLFPFPFLFSLSFPSLSILWTSKRRRSTEKRQIFHVYQHPSRQHSTGDNLIWNYKNNPLPDAQTIINLVEMADSWSVVGLSIVASRNNLETELWKFTK